MLAPELADALLAVLVSKRMMPFWPAAIAGLTTLVLVGMAVRWFDDDDDDEGEA